MKDARLALEIILAAAAVTFGWLFWQKWNAPAPVGVAVEAKPDKRLTGVQTETVPTAPVVAYKPEAKKRLNLPKPVQDDAAKVVTGSAKVQADIRPHSISAVVDTATGKTTIYDTRLALPWFAIDTSGEAGISYGQRGSDRIVRLEVRQSLADIKAVRVGAVASYDMPLGGGAGSAFVGIGAWYRW